MFDMSKSDTAPSQVPYDLNKAITIFEEFSRNKAKNPGRSRKNAGNTSKCGIPQMIAGWLTPMMIKHTRA